MCLKKILLILSFNEGKAHCCTAPSRDGCCMKWLDRLVVADGFNSVTKDDRPFDL